jgi:integrase
MRDGTPTFDTSARSMEQEIAAVIADLTEQRILSEQSLPRVVDLARRLERFVVVGVGRTSLSEVTGNDVRLFVEADAASGPVSVSTMHLRRSLVRLVFRTGRSLGLVEGDPTLDVILPRRSSGRVRALDDAEVAVCRSAALHSLTSTRLAAAWALAEASARTAELPRLSIGDLDLDGGRVWIHGTARTIPRWGLLSAWGIVQLERHLRGVPCAARDQLLVYRGSGSAGSRQASACIAITEVLTRAGLAGEPDVRPLSVTAWAGRQILDETGRIEGVARRLGLRSLDRAARLIGFDWDDR